MRITSEARIIAAFTFLTAMLLGAWRDISDLVAGLLSPTGEVEQVPVYLAAGAVIAAVTALTRTATADTETPWAKHLGGAAIVIGALATLAALLRIVIEYLPS